MVDSQKQLTVTIFSIIAMQLLELLIPVFLFWHALGIEIETNFDKLILSFQIHFVFSEGCTLRPHPVAQGRVCRVPLWHIACKAGRETDVVLVGVFKVKENGRQRKTTYSDHDFHNSPAAS
jgi:hypothetical protein